MKIEFRKVPLQSSKLSLTNNSVNFLGTFSKITPKLVKLEAKMGGILEVDCCKCGKVFPVNLDEDIELLLSDGIFKPETKEDEEYIAIEIDDSIIDFEDILQSEIESFKSDYFICDDCKSSDSLIELEY